VADGDRGLVGQGEELGVLLEPFGHGEFVDHFVVAFDFFTVRHFASNSCRYARLGDVVADAPLLPVWITRTQGFLPKRNLFNGRNLVVGYANTLTPLTILLVKSHYRMCRCPRTAEKVQDYCIGLVRQK
jgi:hypothetical protein